MAPPKILSPNLQGLGSAQFNPSLSIPGELEPVVSAWSLLEQGKQDQALVALQDIFNNSSEGSMQRQMSSAFIDLIQGKTQRGIEVLEQMAGQCDFAREILKHFRSLEKRTVGVQVLAILEALSHRDKKEGIRDLFADLQTSFQEGLTLSEIVHGLSPNQFQLLNQAFQEIIPLHDLINLENSKNLKDLAENIFALASRLPASSQEVLLSFLISSESVLASASYDLKRRSQKQIDLLRNSERLSTRDSFLYYSKAFLSQALDPEMIISFTLAGMAYRARKASVLNQLWKQSPKSALGGLIQINRGQIALARASTAALLSEIAVFSGLGLAAQAYRGQEITLNDVSNSLALNAVTLTCLKLSFYVGMKTYAKVSGMNFVSPTQSFQKASLGQIFFAHGSGIAGLMLGHNVQYRFGLTSEQRGFWKSALDAAASQTSLSIGARLAGVFTRPFGMTQKEFIALEEDLLRYEMRSQDRFSINGVMKFLNKIPFVHLSFDPRGMIQLQFGSSRDPYFDFAHLIESEGTKLSSGNSINIERLQSNLLDLIKREESSFGIKSPSLRVEEANPEGKVLRISLFASRGSAELSPYFFHRLRVFAERSGMKLYFSYSRGSHALRWEIEGRSPDSMRSDLSKSLYLLNKLHEDIETQSLAGKLSPTEAKNLRDLLSVLRNQHDFLASERSDLRSQNHFKDAHDAIFLLRNELKRIEAGLFAVEASLEIPENFLFDIGRTKSKRSSRTGKPKKNESKKGGEQSKEDLPVIEALINHEREGFTLKNREHQWGIVDVIRTHWAVDEGEGVQHVVVSPTGSGKTRSMMASIEAGILDGKLDFTQGHQVFIFTHLTKITDQNIENAKKLLDPVFKAHYGREVHVTAYAGGKGSSTNGDVVIISVPKAGTSVGLPLFTRDLELKKKAMGKSVRYIILDETHHSDASTWDAALSEVRKNHAKSFVVGFTATLTYEVRSSSRVIFEMSPLEALLKGIIPNVYLLQVRSNTDISNVDVSSAGEFNLKKLGASVRNHGRDLRIMQALDYFGVRADGSEKRSIHRLAPGLDFRVSIEAAREAARFYQIYMRENREPFQSPDGEYHASLGKREIYVLDHDASLDEVRRAVDAKKHYTQVYIPQYHMHAKDLVELKAKEKSGGKKDLLRYEKGASSYTRVDGVVAVITNATNPNVEMAILKAWREGHIETVINCKKLGEGYDAPWVQNLIGAKPTMSSEQKTQEGGRIQRYDKGEVDQGTGQLLELRKRIWIDVVDNAGAKNQDIRYGEGLGFSASQLRPWQGKIVDLNREAEGDGLDHRMSALGHFNDLYKIDPETGAVVKVEQDEAESWSLNEVKGYDDVYLRTDLDRLPPLARELREIWQGSFRKNLDWMSHSLGCSVPYLVGLLNGALPKNVRILRRIATLLGKSRESLDQAYIASVQGEGNPSDFNLEREVRAAYQKVENSQKVALIPGYLDSVHEAWKTKISRAVPLETRALEAAEAIYLALEYLHTNTKDASYRFQLDKLSEAIQVKLMEGFKVPGGRTEYKWEAVKADKNQGLVETFRREAVRYGGLLRFKTGLKIESDATDLEKENLRRDKAKESLLNDIILSGYIDPKVIPVLVEKGVFRYALDLFPGLRPEELSKIVSLVRTDYRKLAGLRPIETISDVPKREFMRFLWEKFILKSSKDYADLPYQVRNIMNENLSDISFGRDRHALHDFAQEMGLDASEQKELYDLALPVADKEMKKTPLASLGSEDLRNFVRFLRRQLLEVNGGYLSQDALGIGSSPHVWVRALVLRGELPHGSMKIEWGDFEHILGLSESGKKEFYDLLSPVVRTQLSYQALMHIANPELRTLVHYLWRKSLEKFGGNLHNITERRGKVEHAALALLQYGEMPKSKDINGVKEAFADQYLNLEVQEREHFETLWRNAIESEKTRRKEERDRR